jgi:hypothetical protein
MSTKKDTLPPMFIVVSTNDDDSLIETETVESVAALEALIDSMFKDWVSYSGDEPTDAFDTFKDTILIIRGGLDLVDFNLSPLTIEITP